MEARRAEEKPLEYWVFEKHIADSLTDAFEEMDYCCCAGWPHIRRLIVVSL